MVHLVTVPGRISVLVALLLALLLVACAGADESSSQTEGGFLAAMADDEAFAAETEESSRDSLDESVSMAAELEEMIEEASDGSSPGFFQSALLTDDAHASVQPQNRVIVRTVDMGIIVDDVPDTADQIIDLAEESGGWQVDSERSHRHQAWLSVRVPAETLEDFVAAIRERAVRVEFETSTSQDVTDEFVDNQSRLKGLRATEERLLEFLSQSAKVEDALKVQEELTRVQLEIESIQGRLRFLSQTAAYSLVNLTLTTKPGVLPVEIGADAATYRVGLSAGFRATFEPPEGVDDFTFTWDFGDGSEPVRGDRTAPTTTSGERVTSTVSHAFTDVEQSPYIVQLNIRGLGDAGLYEGSDTLIATVTEIPAIEVFAGDDRVVDEGGEVEYSGSFTRPETLWDFKYRWDFGDGTATVLDVPAEGDTRAMAAHAYRDFRREPYRVTLTVSAQSEAGEVKGSSAFFVTVNEVEGFVVGGWDAGGTAKSAVRALTAVGQVLLIALIWMGILSPVWLAVLALVIFLPRLRRRFWPDRGRSPSTALLQFAGRLPSSGGEDEASAPGVAGTGSQPATEGSDNSSGVVCQQCGRNIPDSGSGGSLPRYCPFCGAETQLPGT